LESIPSTSLNTPSSRTRCLKDIGIEPSLETFRSNVVAVSNQLGRRSLATFLTLPWFKDFAGATQSISFLSVREKIVCIDDLERKGKSLSMKDVLGLVAHLRDQKKCKVVLILNDDALADDSDDKKAFTLYNEKVIDESLVFAPDASDCVRIAIGGGTPAQDLLRAAVVLLDISTIRVIKKIERLVMRVVPILKDLHPNVLHQAVQSLTLLGWSAFSKDGAPDLEFLRSKGTKDMFGLGERQDLTGPEKGWNALLDSFGFNTMDEFDFALLDGIERGFFDEHTLTYRAGKLDEKFKAAEGQGSLEASWRPFHDSFGTNDDEVLEEILAAFRKYVRFVAPGTLNAMIRLLKGSWTPPGGGGGPPVLLGGEGGRTRLLRSP
jgi:hypothetical protein